MGWDSPFSFLSQQRSDVVFHQASLRKLWQQGADLGWKVFLVSESVLFLPFLFFELMVFDAFLCFSHTSVFLLQGVACLFLFLVSFLAGRGVRYVFLHTKIEVEVKGAVIKPLLSVTCTVINGSETSRYHGNLRVSPPPRPPPRNKALIGHY